MIFSLRALLYALAVLSTLEPILAKRNFGGGGRHSYPKAGGGGLSGGGSHSGSGGYSGGGHVYPSSGGMSGGRSPGGSQTYPANTGGAAYPSNTHHSNTHGYPSGKGLSGNTQPAAGHTTNIHNNYHYSPPQQIRYTPVHGGAPVSYPVYHGTPPTYVYQYKDSGSKYGTLLTGLALLNLGTLAAGTAYAVSHSGHGSGSSSGTYKPQAGEVCKFGIRKDNGDYEETRIDCQLISSFILQSETTSQNGGGNNAIVNTTTVTNTTVISTTNGSSVPAPAADAPAANNIYIMLPNGTLVPQNMTTANVTSNTTSAEPSPTSTMGSSITVTTTTVNTTVTNAQDVKGKPIPVTPGMKCYVIRQSSISNMRKSVDCGLLQTYAEKSIRPNSAVRHAPTFTILAAIVAFVLY